MSLNDFYLGKYLGKGSFGSVQIVQRKSDNQYYAMKRISMSKLGEKDKKNALNEIRLLASLKHKNIIGYKEAFFDDASKTLNIVMEYADGGDISSKIRNNLKRKLIFEEKTIWNWAIQLLEGIQYLHNNKIMHRDLKSANLFLLKNGTLKIGDLNVSTIAKNDLAYTQTGTPYYAPPEIWKDKPYNYKCDIWSAGCIIYEICTLHPPFRGTNFKELYNNIIKGNYLDIGFNYSNDLRNLLKMMIVVNPDKRFNVKQILNSDIVKKKIKDFNFKEDEFIGGGKAFLMKTIKLPKDMNEINRNLPKRYLEKTIREEEMMKNDDYEMSKATFYKSIMESEKNKENNLISNNIHGNNIISNNSITGNNLSNNNLKNNNNINGSNISHSSNNNINGSNISQNSNNNIHGSNISQSSNNDINGSNISHSSNNNNHGSNSQSSNNDIHGSNISQSNNNNIHGNNNSQSNNNNINQSNLHSNNLINTKVKNTFNIKNDYYNKSKNNCKEEPNAQKFNNIIDYNTKKTIMKNSIKSIDDTNDNTKISEHIKTNSNFEKSELNSKNQPIILNNNVENIKKDNVSTPLIIDNNNEKKLIPKTPIQDNKIYISSPIMKNKNHEINNNNNKINYHYHNNNNEINPISQIEKNNNQIKMNIKRPESSSNQIRQNNLFNYGQNRPNSVGRQYQIIGNNNNYRMNFNNNNNNIFDKNRNFINEYIEKEREINEKKRELNEINKNIKLLDFRNNKSENKKIIRRPPSNPNPNLFNKGYINNAPIFQYKKINVNPNRKVLYGKVEYQRKGNERHYYNVPVQLQYNYVNHHNYNNINNNNKYVIEKFNNKNYGMRNKISRDGPRVIIRNELK